MCLDANGVLIKKFHQQVLRHVFDNEVVEFDYPAYGGLAQAYIDKLECGFVDAIQDALPVAKGVSFEEWCKQFDVSYFN